MEESMTGVVIRMVKSAGESEEGGAYVWCVLWHVLNLCWTMLFLAATYRT
jgi:hypothetical protein